MHGARVGRDLDDETVVLLGHQSAHGPGRLLHQSSDLDVLGVGVHPVRLHFAEVEHVVDEAKEVSGVRLDLAEVGQQARLTEVFDLLLHHLAVADYCGERRSQLVAHVGQEGTLGLVGGLGGVFGSLGLRLGHQRLVLRCLRLRHRCQRSVLGPLGFLLGHHRQLSCGLRFVPSRRERGLPLRQGGIKACHGQQGFLVGRHDLAQGLAHQDHAASDSDVLQQSDDLADRKLAKGGRPPEEPSCEHRR